jgi:hypothetical protein
MQWNPKGAWSAVHVFLLRHEAELACEVLRSAGIEGRILADDCGSMGLGLQTSEGVAVYVETINLEDAREALQFKEEG